MDDHKPIIERIKDMIAYEQQITKRKLSQEHFREFEQVFNSNQAINETVKHLFDFAVIINNGCYINWCWISHIVNLFKSNDPSLNHALEELSKQLGNGKLEHIQLN